MNYFSFSIRIEMNVVLDDFSDFRMEMNLFWYLTLFIAMISIHFYQESMGCIDW